MSVDIKIEPKGDKFEIVPLVDVFAIRSSVKDALDDIADAIEYEASIFAPESDPADKMGSPSARHIPSGALKAHPVDITESDVGVVANISGEAEGFRSIRGAGGRFVKGKGSSSDFGHIFYNVVVSYPGYRHQGDHPYYAKFVAFGTHSPIVSPRGKQMKFRYKGRNYKIMSVPGQAPQPYLDEATHAVSTTYLPIKIRELRTEIDAIT